MKSFTLAHLFTLLSVCLTLTRISAFAASANFGYISVIIKNGITLIEQTLAGLPQSADRAL